MRLFTAIGTAISLLVGQLIVARTGSSFVLDVAAILSSGVVLIVAGLLGSALSIKLITRVDPIIALGTER